MHGGHAWQTSEIQEHGCFSEEDNSILSVFFWEPLRAKLQHEKSQISLQPWIQSRAEEYTIIIDDAYISSRCI